MGLSKLSEACKKCPYVDTCNHKRMEAVGYLPTPKLNTLNSQITLTFSKRIYQEDSGRKQDLYVLSSTCWAI